MATPLRNSLRRASAIGVRSFSTTSPRGRVHVPGMGDIEPTEAAVETFKKRQKEFRERPPTTPTHTLSNVDLKRQGSIKTADGVVHGLGLFSTAKDGSEADQESHQKLGKEEEASHGKEGRLKSLIYGTKEGREMDAQMEASFSALLARGKYVHSIVQHEVKPDKVEEYVELVGNFYPRLANLTENNVHLVGSWGTEIGDCDTFIHIWEYKQYLGYHASRYAMTRHPEWEGFNRKLKSLIYRKRISLMQEFSFWPTAPPRQLGGLFELRSYTLRPGNLLEWETHWRRGLKARREVMEGVGAWFVQVGDLNMVHHLWQFANLEERRLAREKCWEVEGWSDTVHKTVPLIQDMKSRILVAMPWSPVA